MFKTYLFALSILFVVCMMMTTTGCAASVSTPVVTVAAAVPSVEPPGSQTLQFTDRERTAVHHTSPDALPMPRNSRLSCGYNDGLGVMACEQGKLSLR